MQEVIYNSKVNLSEHYPDNSLKNLFRIFPRLKQIVQNNNTSNGKPILIDKFLFYRIILEKIKNYFELSESFVISESIDIILKDIKNREKEQKSKAKTEFPLINNKFKIIPNKHGQISNINRNFSTKISRNKSPLPKINTEIKTNNEKYKNYTPSVNKIYINFDKSKETKMKLVHFADFVFLNNSNIKDTKSKTIKKKNKFKI